MIILKFKRIANSWYFASTNMPAILHGHFLYCYGMKTQFLINWNDQKIRNIRNVLQLHKVFDTIVHTRGIRQKENCRAISHIWCGSQTHNNPSAIRTQLANILAILRPTTLLQESFYILSTNYYPVFASGVKVGSAVDFVWKNMILTFFSLFEFSLLSSES